MKETIPLLEKLIKTAQGTELDLRKFEHGNSAAGVRVRRVMQNIRAQARNIRTEIQEIRKLRKEND